MHKAGNGDCISISTDTEYILIDGGTAQSYDTWKSKILETTNTIDTLIITHIDNDHVNGIIKLLEDPQSPKVKEVLYNGAEQLLGKLDLTSSSDRQVDSKLNAIIAENLEINNTDKIGYSEGSSLSFVLNQKSVTCNTIVNNGAIYREKISEIKIGNTKFSIIGPTEEDLLILKRNWDKKLYERKIKLKILNKIAFTAFENYLKNLANPSNTQQKIGSKNLTSIEILSSSSFEPDRSPTNQSSFSFLIEREQKKILYLGDCHVQTVILWLNLNRLDKISVDAVKISHHGSKNNTSLELLDRIECQNYLISTNGKVHNHPDLETLARIIISNKNKYINIYFNYEVMNIPSWFINDLETNYKNVKLHMNCEEVEI
ncbi:MBL fold metallo-hydrolase [Acinetobacter baumannii]|uniref:ComEC/Rec2 family competence protein n=1 Tax=Acinetobacter baumannii TaxID=470 RepID=UPI00244D1D16|nr:MBL fold metallo-hydrolase [Acinetobacter baumannii]MDH2498756.1 MBL fold metallo-hydrolase [Acinetobacter baumannii]